MTTIIIILLVLLTAAIAGLFWLAGQTGRGGEQNATLLERLNNLAEQNRELRQLMDNRLRENHDISHRQFAHTTEVMQQLHQASAKTISEVTEKLTKLDETNRQVVNFSAQLQKLQDILKNPKQRGVLGEYFLEETLKNVLPPDNFAMQYKFKNGEIVDAAVFVKDLIVPIDSKFSLENYEKLLEAEGDKTAYERAFKQDLKLRIDETAKYIRPAEHTTDFAFMFIPSEAIFYDLLTGKVGIDSRNLIEYAFINKRVIIVSPTSFLAYLQTVLHGLRAMQIEESAKSIRDNVHTLGKHLQAYENYLDKLGKTLGTVVNHFNSAAGEFKKVDKDIARITNGQTTAQIDLVEGPRLD